jgi:7-cyano-7-deazaguanine reductase
MPVNRDCEDSRRGILAQSGPNGLVLAERPNAEQDRLFHSQENIMEDATINFMPKPSRYTPEHAAAGLDASFPEIETWPNQFPGYEIVIDDPEFTSVCPKTGLPDFGVITLRYQPDKACLELKSYKEYLHVYRNLGIFQENVVNRVLEDVVRWAKPVWAEVKGDFRPRGGISTTVLARWPRARGKK